MQSVTAYAKPGIDTGIVSVAEQAVLLQVGGESNREGRRVTFRLYTSSVDARERLQKAIEQTGAFNTRVS